MILYRGKGSEYRRRKPLLADHRIVVDGSVIEKGAPVPDSVPLGDRSNLVAHGYADPQSARSYSH